MTALQDSNTMCKSLAGLAVVGVPAHAIWTNGSQENASKVAFQTSKLVMRPIPSSPHVARHYRSGHAGTHSVA
jgi:hypothetical protein